MKIDPNDPAFATPDSGTEYEISWQGQKGLTIRQYFSVMAMQGMLLNGAITPYNTRSFAPDNIASLAVQQADALISELNKKEKSL